MEGAASNSAGSSDNASRLTGHPSNTENVHIMLIEYSRYPIEFQVCLAEEPLLQHCLSKLSDAGHNVFFGPDEPKLYVEPELVAAAKDKLSRKGAVLNGVRVLWHQLKARHVLASDAYYHAVKRAVQGLRRKLCINVKSEAVVEISSDDDVDVLAAPARACVNIRDRGRVADGDLACEVVVHETMIHVDVPSSLWSGTSAGDKTWSTPTKPNKRSRKLQHAKGSTWTGPGLQLSAPQSPPRAATGNSQSLGGFSLSPSQLPRASQSTIEFQAMHATEESSDSLGSLGMSGLGLNEGVQHSDE